MPAAPVPPPPGPPACSSRDAQRAWEKLDGLRLDGCRWKVRPATCGTGASCTPGHSPACCSVGRDYHSSVLKNDSANKLYACPWLDPGSRLQVDWAVRKDFDFFGWKWTEGPSRSPSRSPSR